MRAPVLDGLVHHPLHERCAHTLESRCPVDAFVVDDLLFAHVDVLLVVRAVDVPRLAAAAASARNI